jgi:hypothetical protein
MTTLSLPFFGAVPLATIIASGVAITFYGFLVAYPLRWMDRSETEETTFYLVGGMLMGSGITIICQMAWMASVVGL